MPSTHLTEDEAKTKWCPFVRFVAGNDSVYPFNNREVVIGEMTQGASSHCLGSGCMAWREHCESQGYCGLVK